MATQFEMELDEKGNGVDNTESEVLDMPEVPSRPIPSAARIPVIQSPAQSMTNLVGTPPDTHSIPIPKRSPKRLDTPESDPIFGSLDSQGSMDNMHEMRQGLPRVPPPPRRMSKLKSVKTMSFANPTDILNAVNTVNTRLDFYLQGAPNFRMADLNVFGVAQPTVSGISTILTLLNCHPNTEGEMSTIWFSSREEPIIYLNRKPFVLRDSEHPLTNIRTYSGISASRLERMEDRLKEDVLREATRWNGLLLVHDELEDGKVIPTWMAIDEIQTPREVFESFRSKGYRVKYVRIPISPEQAPEDRYLDEYVSVIKQSKISDALIFNCGMGVGRTTFAMVVAMLTRRAQIVSSGQEDPIPVGRTGASSEGSQLDLLNMAEQDSQNRAMLRMVYILEKGLSTTASPRSAVDWMLARGPLIADLKAAILGNYRCILQLCSVLSQGSYSKKVSDEIINRCDVMINLREVILMHRVQYSTTGEGPALEKALGCLERYFFLIAFGAYVNDNSGTGFATSFAQWVGARPEITSMLDAFRSKGKRLYLFRPVEDLSLLSEDIGPPALAGWGKAPKRPMAADLEKYVIKSRHGTVLVQHTILKIDHWSKEALIDSAIEGAANFRKIPNFNVYGVAQPTIQGMKNVVSVLASGPSPPHNVLWINLREEPLIYINGVPYVLRDQYVTLRNIKSYSGITSSRLERIESRLKEDVVGELEVYDGRVLLHGETEEGKVVGDWEDCRADAVLTLREAFGVLRKEESEGDGEQEGIKVYYERVPLTAETPPNPTDFDELLGVLKRANLADTAIVLNCQIGAGRSTLGTVVTVLVLHWLTRTKPQPTLHTKPRLNYQPIHSLLRIIRNGVECKRIVDDAIDLCGATINLREAIETLRLQAENETDERMKNIKFAKGLLHLKRYFFLIAFQSYLDQHEPGLGGDLETFKGWLERHPEFASVSGEIGGKGAGEMLVPVEHLSPGDGIALSTEVLQVVNSRNGAVLAQGTILKYDMFPGAQKMSLTERIEGAPNYRRIPLTVIRASVTGTAGTPSSPGPSSLTSSWMSDPDIDSTRASAVFGIGMPTKEAIRTVLTKVGANPGGMRQLVWTSLREEPVLYVNGRPYVLRLFQDPMKNLEATGIARERVEQMEQQMKRDAVVELRKYDGRMLLHEEHVDNNGFSIVPVWETVKEEDVQTPLEMYRSVQEEGFHVDYLRIPVTDEQAPIPDVFDQLVERMTRVAASTDIMFNCQMGRGRTTTGMVITCLMEMIVGNSSVLQHALLHEDDDDNFHQFAALDTEESVRARYLDGEYKVILQLIAVLAHGKLSKRLTDRAIDACDHIQNLRSAIFDYRLRTEALEPGSRKRAVLEEVGLNYLVRYFYLIVFADYLLEVWAGWKGGPGRPRRMGSRIELDNSGNDGKGEEEVDLTKEVEKAEGAGESAITAASVAAEKMGGMVSFSAWLSERREILSIIRKGNQTLD
ncbi:hypothetical protein HDV00_000050 [Rhizophlyctis rosea]|nr:hypothetical protein HDV00_000050 [Rhizophlyctis rosea]